MRPTTCRFLARQRGFSLVELMVALVIGLFVSGGVAMIFVSMKSAFVAQGALSQLQDDHRLAVTMLVGSIEHAGYFPDPLVGTLASELPASTSRYGDLAVGQRIVGTAPTSGSDSITTRYVSASGSDMMNCLGNTHTAGGKLLMTNTYVVNKEGLQCSTDGGSTFTTLLGSVSEMSIAYGVDTTGDGSAFSYMPAPSVTLGNHWSRVRTVRLAFSFTNPYAAQAGQPATIGWVQLVSLKNP